MNLLAEIDDSKIYFLDEVGFNISMHSRQGRSLRGTRAIKVIPALRSRNISICSVMSKNGLFDFNIQTRAFNTSTFHSYISSLMSKFEENVIQSAVLIMDNVPFHKSTEIKNLILE